MIPINQQADDDCFRACFASLLELPLESVPEVNWNDPENWLDAYRDFLKLFGLGITFTEQLKVPPGYAISVHHRPGRDSGHCVVYFDGQMVHDPAQAIRPLGERKHWFLVYLLDPSPTGLIKAGFDFSKGWAEAQGGKNALMS